MLRTDRTGRSRGASHPRGHMTVVHNRVSDSRVTLPRSACPYLTNLGHKSLIILDTLLPARFRRKPLYFLGHDNPISLSGGGRLDKQGLRPGYSLASD